MFARVKQSRNGTYLQIVENYRDSGRVRQRMVHYVGHYGSLDHAMNGMARELTRLRSRATKAENHYKWLVDNLPHNGEYLQQKLSAEEKRRDAEALAERLQKLRDLVEEHPELLARDRERATRYDRRVQDARAWRREGRTIAAK